MSKKCLNCGAELAEKAAFCPYCATSQIIKTAVKAPVLWRKKAVFAVAAAFCILLAAVIPLIPTVPAVQEDAQPRQISSEEVPVQLLHTVVNDVVASGICGVNLTWELDSEGTLTISGEHDMERYTAENYENRPWQEYHQQIKKIVIEDGVTTIGGYAFYDCRYLTSVIIPKSVTDIGLAAFRDCSSLTNVFLPESLSRTAGGIFSGCTSLISVNIPQGVTCIWDSMFKDCYSLTNISIPKSVTSINNSAFSGCSSLKEIVFEGDAPEIGSSAFKDVTATAYFAANNAAWTMDKLQNYGGTLDWYSPHDPGKHNMNGVAYEKFDELSHVQKTVCPGCPEDYEIIAGTEPHSVGAEGDRAATGYAPAYCSLCASEYGERLPMPVNAVDCGMIDGLIWELTEDGTLTLSGEGTMPDIDTWPWEGYRPQIKKAVIEDGITTVGNYVFKDCKALTDVTIPNSVERIRGYAFLGCSALTEIRIPESVYYFGASAFEGCSALTEITIPEVATKLSAYAIFKDCRSLTSITLPDGLESIPDATFLDCRSLTGITVPASVTSIGDYAFNGCTSLKEIVFEGSAPYISGGAFDGHVNIDAYYPTGDASWTVEVLRNYDFLNWHGYS